MGSSEDKAARKYAVPVRGSIWGLNYNDRSERDTGTVDGVPVLLSDYHDYFPGYSVVGASATNPVIGASRICPIRILKPHYGELAELYVDLQLTLATGDTGLTMKLAVGRLVAGIYDRVTTYTDEEIDASWRRIRGSDTPLSASGGVITADLINILNEIPKYGSSEYRQDVFVLLVVFNRVPLQTTPFKFNYLNIHTSVTGVL